MIMLPMIAVSEVLRSSRLESRGWISPDAVGEKDKYINILVDVAL